MTLSLLFRKTVFLTVLCNDILLSVGMKVKLLQGLTDCLENGEASIVFILISFIEGCLKVWRFEQGGRKATRTRNTGVS